jgi:hypothetical protein
VLWILDNGLIYTYILFFCKYLHIIHGNTQTQYKQTCSCTQIFALYGTRTRDLLHSRRVFPPLRHKAVSGAALKKIVSNLVYSRRIHKKVPSYEKRLQHFSLLSLANHRALLDLLFLYERLNHKIDCPMLLQCIKFRTLTRSDHQFCPWILLAVNQPSVLTRL